MIRTSLWAAIFVLSASTCWALDLDIRAEANNLYWAPTHENTVSGRTFSGADIFWGGEGSVTQDLGDGLTFRGGIELDPVLRNRVYAQMGFQLDSLSLKFAPFLGALNSSSKWFNPGMEALLEYNWPGLFFARGGFLTTFAPVARAGDYYLSSLTGGFGVLMENGILSLNIEDKGGTFRLPQDVTTVDFSTKYWVDLEMFLKNFPFRWAFLTGYQVTGRSYLTAGETSTPVHSILVGGRVSWDFGQGTLAYLDGTAALFQQGWDEAIVSVPSTTPVLRVVSGVRYHW